MTMLVIIIYLGLCLLVGRWAQALYLQNAHLFQLGKIGTISLIGYTAIYRACSSLYAIYSV
jgi:hypothetical protein